MNLNDIQNAVIDRVEAATGLLPIKLDAKTFDPGGSPYAELIVSPSDTQPETIDGGDVMSGQILVKIHVKSNSGSVYPAFEGQKFLDLFPRFLRFNGVEINRKGTIRKTYDNKDTWWITPVLIEYEADSCLHQ